MNIELKKRSPYPVASLTLGIISIVLFLFWYISIPTSVLAIYLGNKGRKMLGSKLAVAGQVTGIVGISLAGVATLIYVLLLGIAILNSY